METGNANPAQTFDAAKFTLDLHNLLSQVSVSGAQNIHNMDIVLNGLIILHNKLKETKEERQETEEI